MRSVENSDIGRVVHRCAYCIMSVTEQGEIILSVPNMPGQVLASCEAQIAWRELSTEEALPFLLL